jgi:LacI family transcriptional regulator
MPAADRVKGWRDALDHAGVHNPPGRLWHGEFGRGAGYLSARESLADSDIDAVFVASDEQAAGVLRALADLGLRCPDDVAVTSFDGIAESAYTIPGLTTMVQPFNDMAREAVSALLQRLDDPLSPVRPPVQLSARLETRGSCGCPETSDITTSRGEEE